MAHAAEGLVYVGIGCLLILFNGPFARGYARFQNRLLRFDLGQQGIRRGRTVAIFVGMVFVLLGVLLLLYSLIGKF
jgi:hypothetical protein